MSLLFSSYLIFNHGGYERDIVVWLRVFQGDKLANDVPWPYKNARRRDLNGRTLFLCGQEPALRDTVRKRGRERRRKKINKEGDFNVNSFRSHEI